MPNTNFPPSIFCALPTVKLFPLQTILDYEKDSRNRLDQLWLGYTESPGSPSLREEISKLYKNISAKDILVHSGAEEAIYCFMRFDADKR